jgi:hypothetical protein
MRKLLPVFLSVACLLSPRVAHAQDGGLMEWLQKMSGPGHFLGGGGYIRYLCFDKDGEALPLCFRPENSSETPGDVRHILEFSAAFSTTGHKARFQEVPNDTANDPNATDPIHLWHFAWRYYYRVQRAVDVGVGIDLRRYSGEGFVPLIMWNYTPASVVITPFDFTARPNPSPWRRFAKLHIEETHVGAISAARFNNSASYRTDGEFLTGISVELDPFVFCRRYIGFWGL